MLGKTRHIEMKAIGFKLNVPGLQRNLACALTWEADLVAATDIGIAAG